MKDGWTLENMSKILDEGRKKDQRKRLEFNNKIRDPDLTINDEHGFAHGFWHLDNGDVGRMETDKEGMFRYETSRIYVKEELSILDSVREKDKKDLFK